MTATQLRRRIARRLRGLSEDRLRAADDFVAYLQDREDNAATRELLAIPGSRALLREAEQEVASGRNVRFAKVRRDAYRSRPSA